MCPDRLDAPYIGRFAPSPTGPLHRGSLVAALASWLDARARGGRWLLRMEDVDEPRSVPGAADTILRQLEACGLVWDGEVMVQSSRTDAYLAALQELRARGAVFGCSCTRRQLAHQPLASDGTRRYPGTCRDGLPPGQAARAWRLRVEPETLCFDDRVQGRVCVDVAAEVGDFVLLRADGWFAYQLAVVVDDAEQGVTHVVRGADLLSSTPRQMLVQRALELPTPDYAHVPVVVNSQGEKLSKQTHAAAIDGRQATAALTAALDFLGHAPPREMLGASVQALLSWAVASWDVRRVAPSDGGFATGGAGSEARGH